MTAGRIKPPPQFTQPDLLSVVPDKVFSTNASARTHYGRTVEEIVESLLGLTDIPNCGQYDHCYDAWEPRSKSFVEIKSVHKGQALPVYEWRMEKDLAVPVPPVYVLALHRCRNAGSLAKVRERMAATLDTLLVVPASVIAGLMEGCPHRQLVKEEKGRMGYKRAGYCRGYRNVPVKKISELPFIPGGEREGIVHGVLFRAVVLRHPDVDPAFCGVVRD